VLVIVIHFAQPQQHPIIALTGNPADTRQNLGKVIVVRKEDVFRCGHHHADNFSPASHQGARIPWWVTLVVLLGAALLTASAIISKLAPTMLTNGDTMTGAARVYADYLFARNLTLALMLLFLLALAVHYALLAFEAAHPDRKIDISRFKGLGEMDWQELSETTMDPATRTLLQVSVEDAAIADEMFSTLMGDDVESRRKFIQENAKDVRFLDI
jgi:DNA gyrase/topoisomerase IV subunit B